MTTLTAFFRSARPSRSARHAATWLACVVLTLIGASAAQAQVQMNCVAVPMPSAYPADWRSTHSLCLLTMTNNLSEPIACDLRAQLDQAFSRGAAPGGDGVGTATERRVFGPGVTVLVTPNVLNWDRLQFQGSFKRSLDRTGHLPAEPIRIVLACENMVGVQSGNQIPDVQIQISIIPSVPSPPALLTPADASQVGSPAPIFSWTPVRLTTGQEVFYQFRLVRVLEGQSPARALDANVPLLESFVRQGNLPYPSSAPRLEDGGLYAWRVQSLVNASSDVADAPIAGRYVGVGLNDGRSPVHTFVWRRPGGGDPWSTARAVGHAAAAAPEERSAWLGSDPDEVLGAPSAPPAPRIGPMRPLATAADSVAFVAFRPNRNWWGPTSGVRSTQAAGSVLGGAGTMNGGATANGTTDATDGTTSPPDAEPDAVEAASGPVSHVPMQIDSDLPQGSGIASKWVHLGGTAVMAGEIYGRSGAGPPARPDQTGQFMAGLNVGLFGNKLNVPLHALISGDQVSFRQTVNQVALHPQWHWGGVHAGNLNPGYSAFSLADAAVLGGGADVVRDGWYVGAVSGRMQRAIQPDTVNAVEAAFQRNVLAGRIGFGQPLGNAIELEVMRVRDDAGSLPQSDTLVRVAPAGNTVFGARARRAVLDSTLTVQVEGAWSRYERNVRADVPVVNGGALSAKIQKRTIGGEYGAAVDYIGGGFITLGNSELAPDRVEGRLAARQQLLAGKLRLGSTLGLRQDDMSRTLGGKTVRRALGVQTGWQPTSLFGSELDLGFLSSRSPGTDFRETLEDLTSSVTISPHLTWNWGGSTQLVSSSVAVQQTDFSDAAARGFSNSRSTTVVSAWQSSVSSTLFLTLTGNYIRSEVGSFVTRIASAGPGVSMTLFRGRAQTNLQLQVTETRIPGIGIDRELTPNIDLRYLVNGRQSLVVRTGFRRYRAGGPGSFDEHLATLQYSAAL